MAKKKFRTKLRFRASRDGWKAADFHRMSDSKGPTVSLFKIKENDQCIGGFTSAKWESPQSNTFVNDSTAILFNLTTNQSFKVSDNSKSIKCSKERGPVFGDGELSVLEPFNGNN
jgi:TLD